MLAKNLPYRDLGEAYLDQISQTRTVANLKRRLERLGYRVTLEPLQPQATRRHPACEVIFAAVTLIRKSQPIPLIIQNQRWHFTSFDAESGWRPRAAASGSAARLRRLHRKARHQRHGLPHLSRPLRVRGVPIQRALVDALDDRGDAEETEGD